MSVTAASGFTANGLHCGIKPDGSPDLSAIAADAPAVAAALFTTSRTAAPPVLLSRTRVSSGRIRGIVVNSGSANAGTGGPGYEDAETMSAAFAESLGCLPDEVLVCSTGPIGGRLPIDEIVAGVPSLVEGAGKSEEHGTRAARGILTTDSVEKQAMATVDGVTFGGMAKGAGMIRPDMATMLAFVTTDAVIGPEALRTALTSVARRTFNALDIDGCQSTNDTLVALASGRSGVALDGTTLERALEEVCSSLSLQMARDAEGASKVVTVEVTGASDDDDARTIALTVADSALVRSSFHGGDPNWGRILGAVGVAGVEIEPDLICISYEGTAVARNGKAVGVDEDALAARLAGDFVVSIEVGRGPGSARVVTTDLTPEYVKFNAERS